MFISIIGTRFSGKSSIEEYLVSTKGFTPVRIIQSTEEPIKDSEFEVLGASPETTSTALPVDGRYELSPVNSQATKHFSFLSMSPLPSPAPTSFRSQSSLCFSSPTELLLFITRNWRGNFVTMDLHTRDVMESFIKRPFFLLVSVDAPLYARFERAQRSESISLEEFVREDDRVVFGGSRASTLSSGSLQDTSDMVNIQITNSFKTISALHWHLDNLDLLDPDHLRPGWDAYFMTLASLASRRSNCMKRRVGAVLVRENRVLATGYNGTPRGLLNCNEGGCRHCNLTSTPEAPYECICLHAEENALLEAGRERIGENAVLYCNTCPCLKCTVKIIQTGVKVVVYNLTYKVDDASALLFSHAGVELRRYDPKNNYHLSPVDDQLDAPTNLMSTLELGAS